MDGLIYHKSLVRVFKPGLLSVLGTAAPFGLAWVFLTTPETSQEGSVGPPIVGLVIGLGAGFAGLVLLGFSIALFVDQSHHRIWGPIVALLYGLGYIIVLILIGAAFSSNLLISLLGITGLTTYALGFVGGIWGFFAGTTWTPLAVGKGVVGSTGRIFFGGLVSFVSLAAFGASIYLLAPLVLLLSPLLLHVGSERRRVAVGFILLGASLATVLPFAVFLPYLFLRFGGWAGYDTYVASFVGILLGGSLAGFEALKLLRRGRPETQNLNLKPAEGLDSPLAQRCYQRTDLASNRARLLARYFASARSRP